MEEIGEWLDASKISLLHLCPQKFQYRHELGLVPKIDTSDEQQFANPAQFGFALHKALESLYDGSGFEQVTCPCPFLDLEGCGFCAAASIPNFLAQFLINYPWDPEWDKDPRTRRTGELILTRYIEKWRNENFDVIAVEVPFTLPFPEFNYIGRIDLVGRWRDGTRRIFPNDHKSTTRFGDIFDQQFKLSLQMTGYMIAVEEICKEPVMDAQINAFRVTSIIQDESFKRIITTRTSDEKERFRAEVEAAWSDIKRYREVKFFPRHAPFACSAYMKRCEYYSLCTAGPHAREELMQQAYEVKPWTPLPPE
jgi:hypothetical protein